MKEIAWAWVKEIAWAWVKETAMVWVKETAMVWVRALPRRGAASQWLSTYRIRIGRAVQSRVAGP